jgi:hypothetical protein
MTISSIICTYHLFWLVFHFLITASIVFTVSGLLLISFIIFMRFPGPPIYASILGPIIEYSLSKFYLELLIKFLVLLKLSHLLVGATLSKCPLILLCSYNSILTSSILVPDPRAILLSLPSSYRVETQSN